MRRNGFYGFCLLIELLRKAYIKLLEHLLMLRIKIMVAMSDGNIGESHVSYINCYSFSQEHLKYFRYSKTRSFIVYFNMMNKVLNH